MPTSCSRRLSFRLGLTLALTLSLVAGGWPQPQRAADRVPGAPAGVPALTDAETGKQAEEAYGRLGVSFEENRGQVDKKVRFLSRHGGATVFLTRDEASFVLSAPQTRDEATDERSPREEWATETLARRERPKPHALHMKYEGGNPLAEVSGERELPGRVNYLRGSDPSKWQTNVRTYGAVRYRGIYDGVDLVYYGNAEGRMEYDFVVAAGADPRQISLKIEGAKSLKLDASGGLVLNTPAGELRQHRPVVYQEVGGSRREVEGGYAVEAGGRVRFKLGEYDQSSPLVIDPVVEYSTYLGGGYAEEGKGIAVDSAGNAYVTGDTDSPDFPTKGTLHGTVTNSYSDAFVTKLSADGSALVYSTYLGGSNRDEGKGIAVDSAGNAYVTGLTRSEDFPVTDDPYQSNGDSFVAKLSADGSAILYSTCFGGDGFDYGNGIAVDSAGIMYVTGYTNSTGFPSSPDTYQGLNGEAFVAKIGSGIHYSLRVGGSEEDSGLGIAVDSSGNAYVTGDTSSADFPVVNPMQAAHGGDNDAFAFKLSADGSTLTYSTYLGGSDYDSGLGVAADSSGNAYVAGYTSSADFPLTNRMHYLDGAAHADVFALKLNASGSALIYSTNFGGYYDDFATSIAVDSAGNAHVAGGTYSPDYPLVDTDTQQTGRGGFSDACVAKLNGDGSALIYSTCFGGYDDEVVRGIALDSEGSAYVTGRTFSDNFPVVNAFQSTQPGLIDAFVMKFILLPQIRGRATTLGPPGVVGVPWATVKLTGSQTRTKLTDAHGYYSFTGLTPGGDYTVTLSKAHLSFVPQSQELTDLRSIIYNADFTVPSLSVANVAVAEGDAGETAAAFTVRLQPASGEAVTVNYSTMNGTFNPAAAGADYTALPPTQLTFAPGETEKTVAVQVRGDASDERNETLLLRLSAPTNAVISDNSGVCTITDDDDAPSLTVSDRRVTEPDAGTVSAAFTVTLSAASSRTVTVKYRTADGTAAAPADYTALDWTTLTFSPGQTTKYVAVKVNGDTAKEGNETFFVNLSAAVNASIADAQGLGKITDDD